MEVNDTGELLYVTDDNDYLAKFTRRPELQSRDPAKVCAIVREFLITRGFGYNPNEGLTRIEKGLNLLKCAKDMQRASMGKEMSSEAIANLKSGVSPNSGETVMSNYKVVGKNSVLSILSFRIYKAP